MTTNSDTLSPPQRAAAEALATGSTVTDAATEAEVSRQTVSGWANHSPEFIAYCNQLQNLASNAAMAAIVAADAAALEAIRTHLEHHPDDIETAFRWVAQRGLSDLAAFSRGPTSADAVRTQQESAELSRADADYEQRLRVAAKVVPVDIEEIMRAPGQLPAPPPTSAELAELLRD
jgi:hypothetical protein